MPLYRVLSGIRTSISFTNLVFSDTALCLKTFNDYYVLYVERGTTIEHQAQTRPPLSAPRLLYAIAKDDVVPILKFFGKSSFYLLLSKVLSLLRK